MEVQGQQGKIKIASDVIMVITKKAVEEVKGIVSFSGGISKGVIDTSNKKMNPRKAVNLENEEKQVVINLSVAIEYGVIIPEAIKEIQQKVNTYITDKSLENKLKTTLTDEGLLITILDDIFFDSGSADIRNKDKNLAKEISELLVMNPPRNITISGHTDNVPINNSEYDSNWHLSVIRAINCRRKQKGKCSKKCHR